MKKILFISGILASLLYIVLNIIAAGKYADYSSIHQTVSELSAIDAPTRPLWVSWMFVYSLLSVLFGWGILVASGQNKRLWYTGWLMIFYSIFGLFWPPMHQRVALAAGAGSMTDVLHIAWTFVTVPIMMLMIWLGGNAFGKQFRLLSIITLIAMVVFGILTSLHAPNISKNLPTPYIGVWERINIGVFFIWVIALAILLLKNTKNIIQKEQNELRATTIG